MPESGKAPLHGSGATLLEYPKVLATRLGGQPNLSGGNFLIASRPTSSIC